MLKSHTLLWVPVTSCKERIKIKILLVWFEVLTAVNTNMAVFWVLIALMMEALQTSETLSKLIQSARRRWWSRFRLQISEGPRGQSSLSATAALQRWQHSVCRSGDVYFRSVDAWVPHLCASGWRAPSPHCSASPVSTAGFKSSRLQSMNAICDRVLHVPHLTDRNMTPVKASRGGEGNTAVRLTKGEHREWGGRGARYTFVTCVWIWRAVFNYIGTFVFVAL
jgi:hypothetical protein